MAKYRSYQQGVCILNPDEADQYRSAGELPSCKTHPHISKREADELTASLLFVADGRRYYEAYWIAKGKRAIVFNEARSWQVTTGAGGFWGWQLLPGGGVR